MTNSQETAEYILHDRDIREPLFEFLEDTCGKVRILEEKTIGRSRADVVMITEANVCGIEIKSDADTYERLKGQVKDYDQFYDCNYAVVGSSHAQHIEEHVPEYWGIITVELDEGKADFYILRKPKANPKMKWAKKLSVLWRPELDRIQEAFGMPKYREKSKAFVISKICERLKTGKISGEELSAAMCNELFERDYTTIAAEIRAYKRKRQSTKRR